MGFQNKVAESRHNFTDLGYILNYHCCPEYFLGKYRLELRCLIRLQVQVKCFLKVLTGIFHLFGKPDSNLMQF